MMRTVTQLIAIALILMITGSGDVWSQDAAATAAPSEEVSHEVEIEGAEGHILRGDYYAAPGDGPAVLLLHQLYTTRQSWEPLIQPLRDAGYHVLAVDLRGYGTTRGRINWPLAQDDTSLWSAWLASQPGVTSIAMIGSSMGSTLALNGCAALETCTGAVVLSPGLNYFEISTEGAVMAGFPKLIVYADRDRYPARDVPLMVELGGESVEVIVYEGRTHGIDLLKAQDDTITRLIEWLGNHR